MYTRVIQMAHIYDLLSQILTSGSIVIECGGHTGVDTRKLCELVPDGAVYCIEAVPVLFDRLNQTLKPHFANLHLSNVALSDTSKDISFFVDMNEAGDCGASSVLPCTDGFLKNYIKKETEITVPGVTLDSFCDGIPEPVIDLLWLDIEGYEYTVLNASTSALSSIKYIYTEVNFQEFRQGGCLYTDIHNLLTQHGFEQVAKWEQGASWGAWQGNVLYRNTAFI